MNFMVDVAHAALSALYALLTHGPMTLPPICN
jgi:hypothetical protein